MPDLGVVVQPQVATGIVVTPAPSLPMTLGLQGPTGPQGPAGPQGPPGATTGDLHFSFTQGTAASTWTINHNLGKFPSVTVVDSSGSVVIGSVQHNSGNQLTLTFSGAFAGTAYLN